VQTDATVSARLVDPDAKIACNKSGCDSCMFVDVPPHHFAKVPFLAHGDHGHRGAVYDVRYAITVRVGDDVSCTSDSSGVRLSGGSEFQHDTVRIIFGSFQ